MKIFVDAEMMEEAPGAQQFAFDFKKSNVDVVVKSVSASPSMKNLATVIKESKVVGLFYHNKFAKPGEAPQQLVARKARPSSRMGCQ